MHAEAGFRASLGMKYQTRGFCSCSVRFVSSKLNLGRAWSVDDGEKSFAAFHCAKQAVRVVVFPIVLAPGRW